MKKLIAKTTKGTEYFYSRNETYQANQQKINHLCAELNNASYKLSENEYWKVYTVSDYDYKNAAYKLVLRGGLIKIYEIWSIYK